MYSRPILHGNPKQRIAAVVPLAVFLIILGLGTWAGRNQLKGAIEASGAFVAAQFGQGKSAGSKPAAKPAAAPVVLEASKPKAGPSPNPSPAPEAKAQPKPAVDSTDAFGVKAQASDGPKVIVEILDKGRALKILDVPIPADCHPVQHADYAGDAVVWGLGHKKASAAACCQACKEHQRQNPDNRPCNVWVWCGDSSGICWTMDIHNHTTGDCWLKHQAKWDNNPDLSFSNLEVNHMDRFSDEFRNVHKTAPEFVPWTAGVVPQELSW